MFAVFAGAREGARASAPSSSRAHTSPRPASALARASSSGPLYRPLGALLHRKRSLASRASSSGRRVQATRVVARPADQWCLARPPLAKGSRLRPCRGGPWSVHLWARFSSASRACVRYARSRARPQPLISLALSGAAPLAREFKRCAQIKAGRVRLAEGDHKLALGLCAPTGQPNFRSRFCLSKFNQMRSQVANCALSDSAARSRVQRRLRLHNLGSRAETRRLVCVANCDCHRRSASV